MTDPLVNSIVLFFLACAFGFVVTKALERITPSVPVGSKVRIRMATGIARSVLVAKRDDEWVFSALVRRFPGEFPCRGESVLVEAAGASGAYLFRVKVKSVDPEPFGLYVEPPRTIHRLNRRAAKRCLGIQTAAYINGSPCTLLNVSPGGAKLSSTLRIEPGDRVSIELGDHRISAWVLDSRPIGNSQSTIRVCFDEDIAL